MNWLSSIKEKSTKIAELYKTELSNFVTNLTDDVKSIGKGGINDDDDAADKPATEIEMKDAAKSKEQERIEKYAILREVLDSFLHRKAIDISELEHKVNIVVSSPEKYLKRDPLNLVMMERKDFTNFLVFYNQHKSREDLVVKVLSFEPTLPQVLVTDEYKGSEKKDNVVRFVLRFVYSMIYLLETDVTAAQEQKESEKKAQEEPIKQNNEVVPLKVEVVQERKEDDKAAGKGEQQQQGKVEVQQENSPNKEEEIYKI